MDYAKKLRPIKGDHTEILSTDDLHLIHADMKTNVPSFDFAIDEAKNLNDQLEQMITNFYMEKPVYSDARGLWHRPFETDIEAVIKTLDDLKSFNINHIFIETYFNGSLILPSNHAKKKMHAFVGNYGIYGHNLLKAFVEEGKKRSIHIHAWVENFFIGQYKSQEDIPLDIFDPTWFLINKDQTILQKNEVNYVFLDPANPDVRKYVLSLYKDILNVSGLASLHLDYIRYPLCYDVKFGGLSDDTGYTKYAIEDFMKSYNYQGDIHQLLSKNEEAYQNFGIYKTSIINCFVKDIKDLADDIKLSTAVFGDPKHALEHKMQDWFSWIDKGWIDLVLPMAYYKDATRVYNEITNMKKMIGNRSIILAGLAPSYIGLHPLSNLTQIDMARKAGAEGVCLFATQNYLSDHFMGQSTSNREITKLLKKTVFKI